MKKAEKRTFFLVISAAIKSPHMTKHVCGSIIVIFFSRILFLHWMDSKLKMTFRKD